MDIIETVYGFEVYIKDYNDKHHSFVITYNSYYTKKKEIIIINNGNEPSTLIDALVFYDSSGGLLFGIDTMYEPHNGKLSYGKGKLNLIFAHYNIFNDERHIRDTYYSLDLSGKPENAKYACSWQTSHSLVNPIFMKENILFLLI